MDFLKATDQEIFDIFNKESNFFTHVTYELYNKSGNYIVDNKKHIIEFNKYRLVIFKINNDYDIMIQKCKKYRFYKDWYNCICESEYINLKNIYYFNTTLGCFVIKPNKMFELCKIIRFVYKLDKLNIFS